MMLTERINNEIKEAMKSRDQVRLDTLRMLKSKILTVDARCNLPDGEVIKLFKSYYGNIQEALEQAQSAKRPEIAEKLQKELSIIQEFLPKALSLEETKKIVSQAVRDSGAKTKKDIGLVMKNLIQSGQDIDRKLAKDLADQMLD